MKQSNLFCIILALIAVSVSFDSVSLATILVPGNYPRKSVPFRSAGCKGKNVVWDFIDTDFSEPTHTVRCDTDSTGRLRIISDRNIAYFKIHGDTTFQIGDEMPLWKTIYTRPYCFFKTGMAFNDSVQTQFEGNGVYSGNRVFKQKGVAKVVIDATGELILSPYDTIRNVTRVYRIKSYSIAMGPRLEKLDTTRMKQVIEESYAWYADGVDFPVFETHVSTTYHNLNLIGSSKYSYCFLPENISEIVNSVANQQNSSNNKDNSDQTLPDTMHYAIKVENGVVSVNYSLDTQADISMILADNTGILYDSRHFTQPAGENYNATFRLDGLRPGVYTLYINVNGKIYSEKVRK